MELGQVTEDWREGHGTLYLTKRSRDELGNYRSVSLTSGVWKVLEMLIGDEMRNYLNKNKLIKGSQHGFTEGRSCLTNLLEFNDDVSDLVDEGSVVDVVCRDVQKVFAKVPHIRLLAEMRACGVAGAVPSGFENGKGDDDEGI